MKNLSSIVGLSLAVMVGSSFAADAPNIVGTWEATSGYWSQTGTDSNPAPAELSQKPVQQNIIIQVQQGNAFHGATIRYSGGESKFSWGDWSRWKEPIFFYRLWCWYRFIV